VDHGMELSVYGKFNMLTIPPTHRTLGNLNGVDGHPDLQTSCLFVFVVLTLALFTSKNFCKI